MCKAFYQKLIQKVGIDKVAHFAVSAFLVLAIGCFVHIAIAAGCVMAIGFAKELIDAKLEWKDLLADALGIVIGVVLLLI